MARGNGIIVSTNPRGKFLEGVVSGTPKPGTHMQIKTSVARTDNGHFTWEVYNRAADGDRYMTVVLLEDQYRGKLATEAYADGDHCFMYIPVAGEELNVLKGDVSGTADDFTLGQQLMVDDGTGKVVATTGSPEAEPYLCLEAVTDPVADVLVHCMYTGY